MCDANRTRPTRLILGVPFRAGRRDVIIARAVYARETRGGGGRSRHAVFDYNILYNFVVQIKYIFAYLICILILVMQYFLCLLLGTWPGAVCSVESFETVDILIIYI